MRVMSVWLAEIRYIHKNINKVRMCTKCDVNSIICSGFSGRMWEKTTTLKCTKVCFKKKLKEFMIVV